MQNSNEINIINLRSGHLKRKLTSEDAGTEEGTKDKEEANKPEEKEKEGSSSSKKCKKGKKKKRKKSKKSSKKRDDDTVKDKIDEKENQKVNSDADNHEWMKNVSVSVEKITKINPIFLWVEQKDSKIISVLCEDYDKRNRIRLSKVFDGRWTAVPRTDRLVKAIEKTKNKISSDICENLVTKNKTCINSTKEDSERAPENLQEKQEETKCSSCPGENCECHSFDSNEEDDPPVELSEEKQKKQKVFLDESQNLINIVNNLMELLDGIKENSIKEKEEARAKRKNQELAEGISNEHNSKRRRHEDGSVGAEENKTEIGEELTNPGESNLQSENVDNQNVHLSAEEIEEKSVIDEHIKETKNVSQDFKENKYIQYNIINKDTNADVNKINIKLSYAKSHTKIYDNSECPKDSKNKTTTDIYDFESEDQFGTGSYQPKNDISSENSSVNASGRSSDTHTGDIPSDEAHCETKKENSPDEKLSVLEKLAKEKPLTNSFEASFRKFIIENEVPSSSASNKNEMYELDIRLPQNNKQSLPDSNVKSNVVNKSETRLLNIKTVHEINNSTLVMNKENKTCKNTSDDNVPLPDKPESVFTDRNTYQQDENNFNEEKIPEKEIRGPITKLDNPSLIPTVHHAGKDININKIPKHCSQKGMVHRGKTMSLEEFENEFVANYDDLITEDETSDDDSSYASGHTGHAAHSGPGFDINLWNNNQSFDHNLNVIEDQQQLQVMKDKRLFDLYNRNKDPSTNLNHIDPMIPLQTQNDKHCSLELLRRNLRSDTEADHASFFESIANINKQNLLHESVFPQDEEFIDLEKIQPEKILSGELNQEHLDGICHSAKDLWNVEHNTLSTKPLEVESVAGSRDLNLISSNKTATVGELNTKTDVNEMNNSLRDSLKADDDINSFAVPESKNIIVPISEVPIQIESTVKNTSNHLVKDIKKPIQKIKTKDNKLDSIINKIIINKNKEEKENLYTEKKLSKESAFAVSDTNTETEKVIPTPEIKQERHEVSEEIIEQINKSPILTLDIDGYEIVDDMNSASKHLSDENKEITYRNENKLTIENVADSKKAIENKEIAMKNYGSNIPTTICNTLSWNHSEHSVDSITNDILNEFCDSNHSDFTNCDKSKSINNSSNNKTIKGWLECSSNSADPVNLKTSQNKEDKNDPMNEDGTCDNLHNTLKLPKETMIYPIPENDVTQEDETGRGGVDSKIIDHNTTVENNVENVGNRTDNNINENNTIDLSVKNNNENKDTQENKSNVGIIKIRKSSELFMNSEQTEPLDLGNHNNEKSTNNTMEKKNDDKCKEEITIKSLLTSKIKKLNSEELIAKSEKSKLLELLTTDNDDNILLNQINETMIHNISNVPPNHKLNIPRESMKINDMHAAQSLKPSHKAIENSEPIEQLKAILSNPNIVVPDPLLVPRSRLPALVTSPAREIPKLMSNIIDYNKMNNELLVISLNNLHKLIQTTDKDDEKLIYNQQLNYLKEQYSKINKTPNPADQNLLNFLDGNNNNKELLNNMFMGYNELLNPFIQPNLEPSIQANQNPYNNVDNLMNMFMYKQYNDMYSNKSMKQNQMKEMMQHKEKDAFIKEFYTLIQNTYPHYTPLEIFDTMQMIQKDMNTNHAGSNNTVREMLRAHHQSKDIYNAFQHSQKDAKTYQQTLHKREPSHPYQHSQEYVNAQKKKQSPYGAPSYPTTQSHHKKPMDKINKLNEMFAMGQHKSPQQVNYEKYYQQQQQLCNPLLAAKLNPSATYFNQPDLSLLTQYGNMGNSMMGLNHNVANEDQLKKLQEEYMVFQQQLQMQQQNYLNYQQMHQQSNERTQTNKTPSRSHHMHSPSSKHTKSPFEHKPPPSRAPSVPDHSRLAQSGDGKLTSSSSTEHAFYNATRNELKHNYDAARQRDKPREVSSKSEANREFEHSLYGGTMNELRVSYNNAKSDPPTDGSTEPARAEKKPDTPSDAGAPSTPKLKIKSNIIDTTTKPKLVKVADPDQMAPVPPIYHHPFAGMNPMLPLSHPAALEAHHPMEDVHPYLWHPLFGNQEKPYRNSSAPGGSKWQWTTPVTINK